MCDLTILSLNCRGLADSRKRRDVLNYLRSKNASIIMLQDIHVDKGNSERMIFEWGLKGWIAPYTSSARGVAILFNNNFDYSIHDTLADPNGNFLILDVSCGDTRFSLCSLYGPNSDSPTFYDELFEHIENIGNSEFIIGGDWNLVIDPEIDSVNYKHVNNKKAREIVLSNCQKYNLIDVWRIMNPREKRYSWRTKTFSRQARLDFFLCTSGLLNSVSESSIDLGYRSDHSLVSITLVNEDLSRGRGLWKFNASLLKDMSYAVMVRETLNELLLEYGALVYNFEALPKLSLSEIHLRINYKVFLDFLLMKIREKTIAFSKKKKQDNLKEEKDLENSIKRIQECLERDRFPNPEVKLREIDILGKKQAALQSIRDERTRGVIIRSRLRWYEEGERSTAYFFGLEKRQYNEKNIKRLVLEDGSEIRDTNSILKEQCKFYRKLYERNDDRIDKWMESIPLENRKQLNEEEKSGLEGPITFQEMSTALKNMPNNKSPGTDGFTVEFFKFFWKDIGYLVLHSINEAYEHGEMSTVQKQGVITCIPKQHKDRALLKNWRPITLLNIIYKIAATCIANRIKGVLDRLIGEEQKGFMKGRFIGENIRLIYDVIHETKERYLDGLLLSVDFEKAFDSVSREFVYDCLNFFGFGESLIR